jgi:hypothetical protein
MYPDKMISSFPILSHTQNGENGTAKFHCSESAPNSGIDIVLMNLQQGLYSYFVKSRMLDAKSISYYL